jgi:hypothetical protein
MIKSAHNHCQARANLLKNNINRGLSEMGAILNQVNFEIDFVEEISRTARGKFSVVSSNMN